jgi:hypothetical protein
MVWRNDEYNSTSSAKVMLAEFVSLHKSKNRNIILEEKVMNRAHRKERTSTYAYVDVGVFLWTKSYTYTVHTYMYVQ